MALEKRHGVFGKVTFVFATKLKSFSFVPRLKRLPFENKVRPILKTSLQASGADKASQEPGDSNEVTADQNVCNVEVTYVQDHDEEKFGDTFKSTTQNEMHSIDCLAFNPTTTLTGLHVESGCTAPEPGPATMETIDNNHADLSHLGFHNTSVGAEINLGQCFKSPSQREEVLSPASSTDLLTSPASSKESILSDSWDKERSWSALHMLSSNSSPDPLSGTLSPCSSLRSGAFTPLVVKMKEHVLAPGSSLMQMSSTCEKPCCDSRGTSPCPLSTHARHRPPPTQLSLLTAILRKGRLPVLSSALQRPYTPCWPLTSVSMTSCLACSAASTVSPINMLKAKSCSSIDRPRWESCQNSEPMKPDHQTISCDRAPMKPPERFDLNQLVTSNSRIESPTKYSPSTIPNVPTFLAVPVSLYKTGHNDDTLPSVPRPPLPTSISSMRSVSPKSNPEKNTLLSCDSNASDRLKSQKLSEKDSKDLRQSSNFSAKANIRSDCLASLPNPSHSSCKSSSFPCIKSLESHDDSSTVFLNNTTRKQDSLSQNGSKSEIEGKNSSSPAFPCPRLVGVLCPSYIPPVSPSCPFVQPRIRSSTPDRCTPSPSGQRSQLSPSPPYSLCSSPSPSLWRSTPDCTDGKNRKTYKIKPNYKAIAAIPTNKLLLEQQAIDDEINQNEALLRPANNYTWEDPHLEMCSPAQLRQQAADLYATINEVLEDPIPKHVDKATVKSPATEASRTLREK